MSSSPALAPGSRLGPYEVLATLGAGGMGEVYRARDSRLGRDVALKVLPRALALDPDRRARLQREAHVLASLNHPNIAGIHELEEVLGDNGPSSGFAALVLEYVEGTTLAERLTRGPLPLDESLAIARQIAAAMEAAHARGVVHRDLKPANIKITRDGVVKVLDFGLAKALTGGGEEDRMTAVHRDAISQSPTLTSPAHITGTGTLLGTAAYMSPEQAKGRDADKRSDLWAFGCVLFEMLSGRSPFAADSVAETLAAVLAHEPDWGLLPAATPSSVRALIRGCLTRDRTRRVGDAAVVGFALNEWESQTAASSPAGPAEARPAAAHPGVSSRRRWLAPALLVGALAGLAFGVLVRRPPTPVVDPQPFRASLVPPDGTTYDFTAFALPAASPDGRWVAFGARSSDGTSQIWLRNLIDGSARPVPGSDRGFMPFWSPDSRSLGFAIGNRLVKTDLAGSPPVTLTALDSGLRGATWNRDDVILFGLNAIHSPIYRIPAAGGTPIPVTSVDKTTEQRGHRAPQFLPDGRHFLYTSPAEGDNLVWLGDLDRAGSAGTVVAKAHSPAFYADGHLLFIRDAALMAQPFDLGTLATVGEMRPLAEQIPTFLTPIRWPLFAASGDGTLIFQSGETKRLATLAWKDRSGNVLATVPGVQGDIREISLSPDGTSLASSVVDSRGLRSLWIDDLKQGLRRRFTFDNSNSYSPVWSPDGAMLYWRSSRSGQDIYRQVVDGGRPDELVFRGPVPTTVSSISPDGKSLLFDRGDVGQADVWLLDLTQRQGPSAARALLSGPADEGLAHFAPNGRWLMYVSADSSRNDVYLTPLEGAGGKRQLSSGGGISPRWRRDGKEAYYVKPGGDLVAVEISWEPSGPRVGRSRTLFSGVPAGGVFISDTNIGAYGYDVTPDGQRFIVIQDQAASSPPLTVVKNWTAILKK